jgi:hypothetical protein
MVFRRGTVKTAWLSITLLLALSLLAACGGGGGAGSAAFSDDFEDSSTWRTSSDPEVDIAYAQGGLAIQVKVIDRVAWSVAGQHFKDGTVSVEATPIDGPDDNAYGLVVRHQDDRNFYRFEISADGYYAVQAPTGSLGWEFLVDWSESPAIKRGRETNRLQVVCDGPQMTFYVNDTQLTQVEDERYAEGDVGVIAGTFYNEPGTHVLFDNFEVQPLGE